MALNVSGTETAAQISDRRRRLTEDVVAELNAWSPREFVGIIRRLHRGTLSLVHLNVLLLLETDGPMSMGALADGLDVSVASATGIVTRMEARGFVERRHGPGDRRVVQVHRTEAGANVFVEIDKNRREGLVRILEQLTDEELAGFLAGYRALRAAREALASERDALAADTPDPVRRAKGIRA